MKPMAVITTVATREQALDMAQAMVGQRLAACAQIEAIESVYRWQGALQHDTEFRLLLKTTEDRYAELEAAILARHAYALPAIHGVALDRIHGPYARWIEEGARPA